MASYELTLKVDLPDSLGNFQEIESKILAARNTAGLKLLEAVMADQEQLLLKRMRVVKKDCREKEFQTRLGSLRLKRWRGSQGGKSSYPLDLWAGLSPRQKVTPGLQAEIVEQCVHKPYAKASLDVTKLTNVERSVPSNWRLIQKFAQQKFDKQKPPEDWSKKDLPELRPGVKDLCPILAIDPDATYVRPRRKSDKKHEVKLAVLYTAKQPFAKSKGKLRWALAQKQLVLPPPNSSAEDLFAKVVHKAVSDYGLHNRTQTICHGDGDSWIKQLRNHYIPQTINRLDPYHAFVKIQQATGLEKLPSHWIRDFYSNPQRLIDKLKHLHHELAEPHEQEKLSNLIAYLQNNLDGMRPSGISKEIKTQYPRMFRRGSGTIESNVDWIVGTRFKRPRMNWSELGLRNLLLLREDFLNKNSNFKPVSYNPQSFRKSLAQELKELIRERASS